MVEEIYSRFGELLAKRRDEARLTQAEVGRRIGLSRASIANLENGTQRVALHRLVDLAGAIGCEAEELLPSRTEPVLSEEPDDQLLSEEDEWIRRTSKPPKGER